MGMMHAATAALRSAELGRQVGAAICTKDGAVIATGTNEVPRAFGGQYWEGDKGDERDIRKGHDTNTVTRRGIAEEIEKALIGDDLLKTGFAPQRVLEVVEESHFGDVIEYVRAVHAEMAAIADAARRGVSVAGSVLYATTFPCHHCARHIVAAGIAEVVFIAPYAKSLALQLHDDALTVGQQGDGTKVPFVPFIGIGPLRFDPLFAHAKRRDNDGKLRQYDRMTAETRIEDRDPPELRSDRLPYLPRERRVDGMLAEAEEIGGFKMKREQE
jgi:deoxycytidylate deaminase